MELLNLIKLVKLMHLVMVLPDDGSDDRRSDSSNIASMIENPMQWLPNDIKCLPFGVREGHRHHSKPSHRPGNWNNWIDLDGEE